MQGLNGSLAVVDQSDNDDIGGIGDNVRILLDGGGITKEVNSNPRTIKQVRQHNQINVIDKRDLIDYKQVEETPLTSSSRKKKSYKALSQENRIKLIDMYQEGKKRREISDELKISYPTVCSVINRFCTTKDKNPKKKGGAYHKKIQPIHSAYIYYLLCEKPKIGFTTILDKLKGLFKLEIALSTICSHILHGGLERDEIPGFTFLPSLPNLDPDGSFDNQKYEECLRQKNELGKRFPMIYIGAETFCLTYYMGRGYRDSVVSPDSDSTTNQPSFPVLTPSEGTVTLDVRSGLKQSLTTPPIEMIRDNPMSASHPIQSSAIIRQQNTVPVGSISTRLSRNLNQSTKSVVIKYSDAEEATGALLSPEDERLGKLSLKLSPNSLDTKSPVDFLGPTVNVNINEDYTIPNAKRSPVIDVSHDLTSTRSLGHYCGTSGKLQEDVDDIDSDKERELLIKDLEQDFGKQHTFDSGRRTIGIKGIINPHTSFPEDDMIPSTPPSTVSTIRGISSSGIGAGSSRNDGVGMERISHFVDGQIKTSFIPHNSNNNFNTQNRLSNGTYIVDKEIGCSGSSSDENVQLSNNLTCVKTKDRSRRVMTKRECSAELEELRASMSNMRVQIKETEEEQLIRSTHSTISKMISLSSSSKGCTRYFNAITAFVALQYDPIQDLENGKIRPKVLCSKLIEGTTTSREDYLIQLMQSFEKGSCIVVEDTMTRLVSGMKGDYKIVVVKGNIGKRRTYHTYSPIVNSYLNVINNSCTFNAKEIRVNLRSEEVLKTIQPLFPNPLKELNPARSYLTEWHKYMLSTVKSGSLECLYRRMANELDGRSFVFDGISPRLSCSVNLEEYFAVGDCSAGLEMNPHRADFANKKQRSGGSQRISGNTMNLLLDTSSPPPSLPPPHDCSLDRK